MAKKVTTTFTKIQTTDDVNLDSAKKVVFVKGYGQDGNLLVNFKAKSVEVDNDVKPAAPSTTEGISDFA